MSMADRDGFIWHDGQLVPWREATTHVLTHSLHYGLAVFEGVRAYKTVNGTAIFRLKEHTDRLFRSAHIMGMNMPFDKATLNQAQLTERGQVAPEMLPDSRVLLTDTPIYQQLAPDSPVLADLNRPGKMPDNVVCHCFYGDILVRVAIRVIGLWLMDQTTSFGDLAVPAYSARAIPNAQSTPHPFVTQKSLEWTLHVAPPEDEARALADYLPETQHGKLLSNPAVQEGVLSVVAG